MQSAWDKALVVIQTLHDAGHLAYVAGGAVRDRLLGIRSHDVDVATDADTDRVQQLFKNTVAVGRAFGVVLVKGDGPPVEVATFRLDGPYSDGRRPDWVRPATPEEDAARRDFTINGLFYDPQTDRVLDWVGGEQDLRAGVIRCIGDPAARFSEDYLRLFRAVRFAARFDFDIETATWKALTSAAPQAHRLAAERVRDELTRIITGPHAGRGLQLLADGGLLMDWLSELAAMRGVEQPPQYHPEGDVFTHTRLALDALEKPSAPLAWATLLHDVGKPPTARWRGGRMTFWGHADKGVELAGVICRRLKLSNADTEHVLEMIGHHMRFLDYPKMSVSTRRRFLALPRFVEHLALHRADCLASNGNLTTYELAQTDLESGQDDLPAPLLTGDDLIRAGYTPDPRFGAILKAVYDRQLEGELTERDQALAFVRENWEPESPQED
jgi:poly(A) polymerase